MACRRAPSVKWSWGRRVEWVPLGFQSTAPAVITAGEKELCGLAYYLTSPNDFCILS